jgi:hypothetical protein
MLESSEASGGGVDFYFYTFLHLSQHTLRTLIHHQTKLNEREYFHQIGVETSCLFEAIRWRISEKK